MAFIAARLRPDGGPALPLDPQTIVERAAKIAARAYRPYDAGHPGEVAGCVVSRSASTSARIVMSARITE